MPFPAILELSSLDGTNGFRISGEAVSDLAGRSVTGAGDINGDGIADLIIGAFSADPNGSSSGASYVVFGRATGFDANLDLSTLDGTNGFQINGAAAFDNSGSSVAAAGDVNGDGIDDLIIGALGADPNGAVSGASYIVFGRTTGFSANLELSALDGTDGFRVSGVAVYDRSGHAVASAGDINGDGIADFIIGAPYANGATGASFVVFGRDIGFAANLDLASLNGSDGFRIDGEAALDRNGQSVSAAGDINGDGIGDLIVGSFLASPGALNAGASYVVFGRAGGFAASLALSSLDGTTGFRINGEAAGDTSGFSVGAAGDFNGDGFDDVVIGAPGAGPNSAFGGGATYLVFGGDGGFAASFDLAGLDGTNGFRINGVAVSDQSGRSVAGVGDLNADGFDDLIIGAFTADPNGISSGASYVVFGRSGGFGSQLNLADLDGNNGFRLNGVSPLDQSGQWVGRAGDINADGIDDLIIGATNADANGADSGAAYVVFGQRPNVVQTGTPGADHYLGGALDDELSGGDGDDTLDGGLGADLMVGEAGNDTYYVDNIGDVTDETGGDGTDIVISTITWTLASGIENLFLTGNGAIDATGNALANLLIGNDGANRLDGGDGDDQLLGGLGGDLLNGGAGADVMIGGAGDDTYVVDDPGDIISETGGEGTDRVRSSISLTLGAELENLQLTGTGNIGGAGNELANQIDGNGGGNILSGRGANDLVRGGGGDDVLLGDDGNDQLLGGDGTDILHGGVGADILQGNDGNDLIYGEAGADILDGGAADDVLSGGDDADQLQGGDGIDQLWGGAGNDVLRGGAGADTLRGGTGDDTYFVDDQNETLIEEADEGAADTVRASTDWTLGDNFERLILEGAGHWNGAGNGLANTITGNSGTNYLEGWGGADTLNGGLGADILVGGTGNDILVGGGGADRFVIRQESVFTSSNPGGRSIETDTISDYALGEDFLDLSVIDAIAATGADDAFSIVAAFDGVAGRMTVSFSGGVTTVLLDVDGDRAADYRIRINGDVRSDTGDWML